MTEPGSAVADNTAPATPIEALLVLCALTLLASSVFTPQIAAVAGRIAGPVGASAAVVLVFLGRAIASVAGMLLGSLLGATTRWRTAFVTMGLLSMATDVALWLILPKAWLGRCFHGMPGGRYSATKRGQNFLGNAGNAWNLSCQQWA